MGTDVRLKFTDNGASTGTLIENFQTTNKIEAVNLVGLDMLGEELSSGTLTKGVRYVITAHDDLDFTTAGAADNNVDTEFTATASPTLDAGDKVKEIGAADYFDGDFVSGLGTGAKAYHDGSAWHNPIPGMTISGSTAGILEIVDDETALNVGGLGKICTSGKVYKLDNSGGSAEAHVYADGASGTTTETHTVSAYVRTTGTGSIRDNGGNYYTEFTNTEYERITATGIPNATYRRAGIKVSAGDVAYILLLQYEESEIATSAIITDGTSGGVTRLADDLRLPVADGVNFQQSMGTLYCEVTFHYDSVVEGGNTGVIDLGSSYYSLLYKGAGTSGEIKSYDNTTITAIISPWAAEALKKLVADYGGAEKQLIIDGVASSVGTYDGAFTLGTQYRFGYGATKPFSIKNVNLYKQRKGEVWGVAETTA